jgi:hypothetical protein
VASTFTPAWLDPADVAAWLRLNATTATADAAELDRVCALTEAYVQRCRPEFSTDPGDSAGTAAVTVDGLDVSVALAGGTPHTLHRLSWGDTFSDEATTDDTGAATVSHTYTEAGTFTLVAYNATANVERTYRVSVPGAGTVTEATYVPDAETYQGAVMYAAREYRRRNSPAGIETWAEGGAVFVAKYDADIERALRTGQWNRPGVG